MTAVMDWFKVIILVQLFFSVSITLIAYAIPEDAKDYVTSFSDLAERIDLQSTTTEIQSNIQRQSDIPVIEVGALIFYSGNILLDLLLNFAFAIPEMISLLINGILFLINIDSNIANLIQVFAGATVMIMYFIGVMQLVVGIRSSRTIG